jgi:hypothetical protein
LATHWSCFAFTDTVVKVIAYLRLQAGYQTDGLEQYVTGHWEKGFCVVLLKPTLALLTI